jgi:hypothetical protein
LFVNAKGEALVTYRADGGQTRRVLAWGAVGARQPNPVIPQARFRLDNSGGWGKYRTRYWQTFSNTCRAYDGPTLAWRVAACKAPDGSYWALQQWQVRLPNLGFTPWAPELRQWELHLSHWTGPLARLEVWQDRVGARRTQRLFGRYTYRGSPVYGFGSTTFGAPTDGYGRLLYLDTHDSAYGAGWKRENAFLSHNPTGVFCYAFYRHDPSSGGYRHPPGVSGPRPSGVGDRYRLTARGPGVTPDVSWSASAGTDAGAAAARSILAGDRRCGAS